MLASARVVVAVVAVLVSAAGVSRAAGPLAAPTAAGTTVLDTGSSWRMYHVLKSPVMQAEGALKNLAAYDPGAKLDWTNAHRKAFRDILAPETQLPPTRWQDPGFDDSDWLRGTAVRAMQTPYLERLCLRGKFEVADPAKTSGLALALDYHGGAIVYVNGQEIARQHLAAGAVLAEAYPLESYVGPDGKLVSVRGDEVAQRSKPAPEALKVVQSRVRTLSVPVPAQVLRSGLNVVAIELVRAPYHPVVHEQQTILDNHGKSPVDDLSWNTCEIKHVRLGAAASDGLVPLARRGAGFQLWNSNPLAIDYDLDQGEAGALQPIRLSGARNGAYSGKVVLGCAQPFRSLSATAGDLKGEGGTIPAAQIQIRYAMPWGSVILTNPGNSEAIPYPADPTPLLALQSAPPEVPVYRKEITPSCMPRAGERPVFGAVVGIWVTVHVPKQARPGIYAGLITLQAEGLKPVPVGVQVKVLDWTLPDPAERKTWVELVQSPDTLALEYNVPLWSPRHWELIGRSMNFLGAVGSRVLFAPLIAQSNAGNDESMVRWVKKDDGTYEYDFSILDKYLDTAERHMGPPQVLIFNAWDWYMGGGGTRPYMYRNPKDGPMIRSPLITVLDRATGKTQNVKMSDYADPQAAGQWKPLFDQLRQRLAKRGLEKAMMLGMSTDNWAFKEQVQFLKDVSGNLPWAHAGHYTLPSLYNGLAAYGYQSSFFGYQFDYLKAGYGWKNPQRVALFERVPLDSFPTARWRGLGEQAIFGNMRGVGRLGGDTWCVVKDKNGQRVRRAWERFTGSNWGYLNCDSSTLAPGPEGAVATVRYEALREGLQECEARIFLEQALTDPATRSQLGDDVAARYQTLMVERQQAFWRSLSSMQSGPSPYHDTHAWRGPVLTGHLWFVASGWRQRSEALYALAGEAARTLAAK